VKARAAGLLFGIGFGFWLCWARFTRYDVILRGLRFQDRYLWSMFGAAVLTAALGLHLLRAAGGRTLLDRQPVGWSAVPIQRAHLIGSAIFGVGWAVAGTCPGPAAAQIGHGQLSGLFTAAGIFFGIWLQGWSSERRAATTTTPSAPAGACGQA
jgi:uncharacterized membrane protein YedE/YeeE